MRLLMLASLLPAAMAAFDQCKRASGAWLGFDQGIGKSIAQAVMHSGTNVYLGGYGSGALSFGSRHVDGRYHDHEGTTQVHDNLTDVTVHHETHSIAATGGSSNKNRLSSQLGQDSFIYKISDDGVPVSVYAMDTNAVDGSLDGTGINGGSGGWSYILGLDSFDLAGETDQIAVAGQIRGRISFPKAGGTPVELTNSKDGSYDPWVAKIDIGSGSVVWATKEGIDLPKTGESAYPVSVVTTLAGDVIATTRTSEAGGSFGVLSKFNGANGALVWSKNFGAELYQRYGRMSVSGNTAYWTGVYEGKDSTAFAPLKATSCAEGASSSTVVAAFDVSPSDAPKASWVTVIGCGSREGGSFVEGDYIYAIGRLSSASALTPADGVAESTCTMTGTLGGYLVKLNKANGKCVWAKDLGFGNKRGYARVVANAESVWTLDLANGGYLFDADHGVNSDGYDAVMGKFQASDGVGLWGDTLGGGGSDRFYDMAMTPTGPVAVGYSSSDFVTLGALTGNNLQQLNDTHGQNGLLALKISTADTAMPSCITSCPSGVIADATTVIADNTCYAGGKCMAHDETSGQECFKCDANDNQKKLFGPDLVNYCFFDNTCHAAGKSAPSYISYNSESVCETCQPDVDPSDWTLASNYFHDRDYANNLDCWAPTRMKGGWGDVSKGAHQLADDAPDHHGTGPCAPNNYGILFTRNSGGCQELPDVPIPATRSAALDTALAVPTSGAVADIGARAVSAIAAVNAATSVDGTQLVSAWYHADQTKCNGASGLELDHDNDAATPMRKTGVCKHTPAAHADEMAALFGTNMHYGHSIARIKVMQALAILDDDFKTGTVTAVKDDMQKDIVAHILVPMYQGAIKAAHEMDTASDKAAALAAGLAYWNLIHPNVPGFDAADKARLVALFGSSAASGTRNYCEVKAILHRNLPDGSMLQYGQQPHQLIGDRSGNPMPTAHASGLPTAYVKHVPQYADQAKNPDTTHGGSNPLGDFVDAAEAVHLTGRDMGTLAAASTKECTYPPPSPPPMPPSVPVPVPSDSDSGLTEGEIAGVAIGATVGGIVLLGTVGLILRSIMFKEAKPVFTCLEKAPAKSPA